MPSRFHQHSGEHSVTRLNSKGEIGLTNFKEVAIDVINSNTNRSIIEQGLYQIHPFSTKASLVHHRIKKFSIYSIRPSHNLA